MAESESQLHRVKRMRLNVSNASDLTQRSISCFLDLEAEVSDEYESLEGSETDSEVGTSD